MKKITIEGIEYEYEARNGYYDGGVFPEALLTYRHDPRTFFYKGYKATYKKKGLFKKKLVRTDVPILIFSIPINIEDPKHYKVNVRTEIDKALSIEKRKQEIERGEII